LRVTLTLALMLIAGCATTPRAPDPAASEEARGKQIAAIATHLIGTPYQFGGADSQGFDCSGLAAFAYERVGLYRALATVGNHLGNMTAAFHAKRTRARSAGGTVRGA